MKNKTQEWALISGAASGIGAELCLLFARDGSNIVLVDRDQDGLEKSSAELEDKFKMRTISLCYDLSLQNSPEQIYQELQNQKIEVDVLVNNAGFGVYGKFWETDLVRQQSLINLNILAPTLLTKLFLPSMVARNRGCVLNVGSVSGFLASPYASTYYASKAFILSFSQGVATSLRGTGVSVTVVCPGPTRTAFNWHEANNAPAQNLKFQMKASEVASQAYRGMRRRQLVVIPGASNKAIAFFSKILPRKLALRIVTLGQEKANKK